MIDVQRHLDGPDGGQATVLDTDRRLRCTAHP
jgi:hypothetical protein